QNGSNGTINAGEQCERTEDLADWRCLGAGDLQCQSCKRSCTDNGTLAQCGVGTAILSGEVKDIVSNDKIFNVLIEVKDSSGRLIATTTTNSLGKYNFSSLQKSFGVIGVCGYKMIVSKAGYQDGEANLFIFDQTVEKNFSLSPNPLATGTKIVLTWQAESLPNSLDLDAHLKFEADNETIDICYGDAGIYNGARISADDNGVGVDTSTEIITIDPFVAGATYEYYVYNYSGTSISSLPVVQIIDANNNILYTFSPQSIFTDYWHVFDFDVDTGQLTFKNEIFNIPTYYIKGYVKKRNGDPIAGARLSLTEHTGGTDWQERNTYTTSANGYYEFLNIPAGGKEYAVVVSNVVGITYMVDDRLYFNPLLRDMLDQNFISDR
ncbi:MAG: carboxypeptidase-like regulatory domain-containing protein, partial [Patescibacteria group bacterium]